MATKKSEATDSSADVLGAILEKLGAMDDKIESMENRLDESSKPPPLSIYKGDADPYTNRKAVKDSVYPDAPSLLSKGDVVRIDDNIELSQLIRTNGSPDVKAKVEDAGEITGRVIEYATTHPRTGEPRFLVNIPGVGEEQVYYKDLEIVSRAK